MKSHHTILQHSNHPLNLMQVFMQDIMTCKAEQAQMHITKNCNTSQIANLLEQFDTLPLHQNQQTHIIPATKYRPP